MCSRMAILSPLVLELPAAYVRLCTQSTKRFLVFTIVISLLFVSMADPDTATYPAQDFRVDYHWQQWRYVH